MTKKTHEFSKKYGECARRSLRTFLQAFTAVLITSLGNAQYENDSAMHAIIGSALTAAIAAGLAAVMNIKGGEAQCCLSKDETE